MPFDPNVTFADAEKARVTKLSIGKERRIPSSVKTLTKRSYSTYHIGNVGPWPRSVNAGSIGWFHIPPKPDDKEYGVCARDIKEVEVELVIKDEFEYSPLVDEGARIAAEICGDGRGRDQAQSERHYGVFFYEGDAPSKEEVKKAQKMLHAKCAEIVREARDLYATDRKLFSQCVRREVHFKAAEVLNRNDEEWMLEQSPTQRVKCPFCGTMNDQIAVKCANCSEIIDIAEYRKLKDMQDEILTAPKKK